MTVTLYEQTFVEGWVPTRPTVVRSRRKGDPFGRRFWVLYPDTSADWFWDFDDAITAAHAWEPYSHDRLTNG